MAGFIPMMGTLTHNLDSKNRIFIPAKHREALGATFVVFPNIKNRASLIISSVEYFEELMKKIKESTKIPAKDRAAMIRYLSGCGDTLTPDAQGRVVLSASLVSSAGLGGATVIHGCYDHAEIWNANVLQTATDEEIAHFAELYDDSDLI